MELANDLVSQFVELTKSDEKPKTESTVYGTTVEYNGSIYVKLDGSDLLTPVSTTTDIKPDERVTVMIKNHSAIVTGNMSSPSARKDDVQEIGNKISEFEIVIADKVSVKEFDAEKGRIDNLVSDNVTIKNQLNADSAKINDLEVDNVEINNKLTANSASIKNLETTKLSADVADLKFATIENLGATNVKVNNLEGTYGEFQELTTKNFEAINADIKNLDTEKISAESANIKYVNIDFANVNQAWFKEFYTKSGMIEDATISNGTITGKLVGVTIVGDLIEGGTVKADKLVVKGKDGVYYKLNVEAGATTSEQVSEEDLQNGLSGTVILAKSITAEKVAVDDLVAFGATIGGFHITDNSIYSGVKESASNTTRGIYLDSEGQLVIGDADNFLKYCKDQNGNFKLDISTVTKVQSDLNNLQIGGRNLVRDSAMKADTEYWSFAGGQCKYTFANGYCEIYRIATNGSRAFNSQSVADNPLLKPVGLSGGTFTLSAEIKLLDGHTISDGSSLFYRCNASELTAGFQEIDLKLGGATAEWKKVHSTFTFGNYDFDGGCQVCLAIENALNAGLCIRNVKLERGDKATDWTPAPEDMATAESIVDMATKPELNEAIDNIKIGGRNLALNTATPITITGTNILNQCQDIYHMSTDFVDLQNEQITISFDYEYSEDTDVDALTRADIRPSAIANFLPTDSLSGHYVKTSKVPSGHSSVSKVSTRFDYFTGSVTISNLKIEKGTRATDWTPAPEDMAYTDDLTSLNEVLIEQSESIKTDLDKILMEALSKYVLSNGDDYSALKEAVGKLELSSSDLTVAFNERVEAVNGSINDLYSKYNDISLIFTITINGVTIGRTESPFHIFMDDNDFSMQVNGKPVLFFHIDSDGDNNSAQAHIPELTVTEIFTLFDLVIDKDEDGRINASPIGGDE